MEAATDEPSGAREEDRSSAHVSSRIVCEDAVDDVAMSWKRTLERMARFGYACKGSMYVIIGALAAATLVGRGEAADRHDAFHFILTKPFGRLALIVIAAGFLGYAAWRVLGGVVDSESHGAGWKGLALRAGSVVRGVFYGWISVELLRAVLQDRAMGKSSDTEARHWTARVMDKPFGRWVVAAAGVSIITYCIWQLYKAVTGKFSKQIRLRSVPPYLVAISRFGIAARSVVLAVVGSSLVRAAWRAAPSRASGTSGAMRSIALQPFGAWLLVLIGFGFAGYGVFAFVNARYRRIDVD